VSQLGLVLSTAPEHGDFERVVRIALAARARDLEVSVFVMDAAVTWAADPRIGELLDAGCDVTACATNLHELGLEVQDGVVRGGQDDHARLVHASDRVLAFT